MLPKYTSKSVLTISIQLVWKILESEVKQLFHVLCKGKQQNKILLPVQSKKQNKYEIYLLNPYLFIPYFKNERNDIKRITAVNDFQFSRLAKNQGTVSKKMIVSHHLFFL